VSPEPRRWGDDDPKTEASAAIARAHAELERIALELERLPAVDVHTVALATHALTSFLRVTGVVVDSLSDALQAHPDPQVHAWLEGLAHAATLMSHTVGRLMSRSVGTPLTLHVEDVEMLRLVERACAYYRHVGEPRGIAVRCGAATEVPLIRTDRVLVATVLDSLLANATDYACGGTAVAVDVLAKDDGVMCRIDSEAPRAVAEALRDDRLEVARRLVALLGGALTTDDGAGEELTHALTLPRHPPGV
jgi:signal transduction histidine kinase